MGTSKIQIISNAISLIGKGPITTIADAGKFATFADSWYDMTLPSVLSQGNWRFATAIQSLSLLVDSPSVDDWAYAYQLPANYLSLVRLYPYSTDFMIYENKLLYSNFYASTGLKVEFRFKPAESRFPDYFTEYFTYYLAQRLGMCASINSEILQQLKMWEMDAKSKAFGANGSSIPNQSIRSNPFIDVRG